jgi:hypothetical protein
MNNQVITNNLLSAVKLIVIVQHQNADNTALFNKLDKALEHLLIVKLSLDDE